jgi:GR25 family glycosyltransferase involved in LPS biosynthesis
MMTNKINKYINKFEAIKGSDLLDDNDTNNIDLNKLVKYDKNLTLKYFYEFINEIGCYLSHVVLIKSLFKTNFKYTVIFEDDFIIVNDNFNEELDTILDSITEDFDILFIGNTVNNHGKQYKNNIYYIDDTNILWGTQGYVINNKNILKIYNNIMCIDNPIDVKYKDLIDKQILKGFVIYPIIVSIMYTESTIRI